MFIFWYNFEIQFIIKEKKIRFNEYSISISGKMSAPFPLNFLLDGLQFFDESTLCQF